MRQVKIWCRGAAGIAALLLLAGVSERGEVSGAAFARQASPQQASPRQARFGQVRIKFDTAEILSRQGKQPTATMAFRGGPGGGRATLTSRLYDMAAPRIDLAMQSGRVSSGTATGGAIITLRDLDPQTGKATRITTAASDSAVYSAATPGKRERIDLKGNVRIVMRSPEFSTGDPFELVGKTGFIEVVDAETYRIGVDEGTMTGTPVEPEMGTKP